MNRLPIGRTILIGTALACGFAVLAWPAKKNKDDETQTLQAPKDLPNAVVAETTHLAFYVTPLSSKGLLSRQVHDALKALEHEAGGSTVVHIRAFVAGSGDLRRVKDLVSEEFAGRKQPLPALSVIQAGALPLTGAQVVLEATAAAKKEIHPAGLAFFSPSPAFAADPLAPVGPLAEASLNRLGQAVRAAAVTPADVLRVTCFLSSLDSVDGLRAQIRSAYPRAAADFVQPQRAPLRALAACEAVAAAPAGNNTPLRLLNPPGIPAVAGQSPVAIVAAPRVVLTGTQVSFGYEAQDARLALTRLQKELEANGASPRDVAFVHLYPLSEKIAAQVERALGASFDQTQPPAGSLLLFEGLSSLDAGFAVEVVAARQ